jgi:predicted lipase
MEKKNVEKKNAGRRSAIDEAKRVERNEAKRVERNEKARNINEAKRLERNEKARNIDEEKRLERNEKARIKRASKKAGASLDNMAVGKFDGKHLMNDIFSSSGVTEAKGICCAPAYPNLN